MKYTAYLILSLFVFSSTLNAVVIKSFGSKKITGIYHIDSQDGNDENNGRTINTAWKTIAKVNSQTFSPGDQILFKRGGIWFETLQITSSGTITKPIVYGSYGETSLTFPVIDAQLTRNNCIYLNGKNNIIIRDLRLQNGAGSGAIRVMFSTNTRIESCSFYVTGHGGVFIENSNNCFITGNNITSPAEDWDKQTDGIYSQRNSGNTYEKNTIVLTNTNAIHHIDGIQSYIDNDLTVRDNFIHQDNPKTNSQGIYTTTGTGVHTYFNNIAYCPNTVANVMGFKNLTAGTASLRAYHNTLIGKGANIIAINGDPAPVVKNNIFVALSLTHGIIRVDSTCINPSNINYNLYHNGGSSIAVTYRGSNISFTQWRALGFEAQGTFANPSFTTDYKLQPGSPAINKGTEVGSICAFDRAGISRPQMGLVDMGAYESFYVGKNIEEDIQPADFVLSQNYPNPFNPSTVIRFTLPEASYITLKIYDMLGNEVASLKEGNSPEGTFEIDFDAKSLASGTYIYQLKGENFVQTRKMMLIK